MSKVKVIGSVFQGARRDGDFGWMLEQEQYAKAFFVFNDNQSQFEAYQNNPDATDGAGCAPGGGNGAIRPYQCQKPPRAGGIPTGDYGIENGPGYPALSAEVKSVIDAAVAFIGGVVEENGYTTLYYSSDGKGGLGHGIFNPAEDVKAYIVEQIESLGS